MKVWRRRKVDDFHKKKINTLFKIFHNWKDAVFPFTAASQTALHFNFCLAPKALPFACLLLIPKNDTHFRGPHINSPSLKIFDFPSLEGNSLLSFEHFTFALPSLHSNACICCLLFTARQCLAFPKSLRFLRKFYVFKVFACRFFV